MTLVPYILLDSFQGAAPDCEKRAVGIAAVGWINMGCLKPATHGLGALFVLVICLFCVRSSPIKPFHQTTLGVQLDADVVDTYVHIMFSLLRPDPR